MTLIESVRYHIGQAIKDDPDLDDIDGIVEDVQDEHPNVPEAEIRELVEAEIEK